MPYPGPAALAQALSDVETAIDAALLQLSEDPRHEALRPVLLKARGDLREALGEART